MKNRNILIISLIITILIAFISYFATTIFNFNVEVLPNSFLTHSVILCLSIIAILLFKKHIRCQISVPNFKSIIKPIVFGFLVSFIGTMITMSIIMRNNGTNNTELNMQTAEMSVLQIIFFRFYLC